MLSAEKYDKSVAEEMEMTPEERVVKNVGKMNAKKHLQNSVQELMASNITQCLGTLLNVCVF